MLASSTFAGKNNPKQHKTMINGLSPKPSQQDPASDLLCEAKSRGRPKAGGHSRSRASHWQDPAKPKPAKPKPA